MRGTSAAAVTAWLLVYMEMFSEPKVQPKKRGESGLRGVLCFSYSLDEFF